MALTVSFSVSQSLANPDEITFSDTSTGTDASIDGRKIYFKLANGNWLGSDGEEYTTETSITWAYAENSKTFSILSKSTSAEITVKWMDGATPVYESTETFCFNLYDYLFILEILQGQSSNPAIIQDLNYTGNVFGFMVNLSNAEYAITYGDDIYSSQGSLSKNQAMIDNQNYYF